ncbi:MAG: hypothetical protein OXF63_03715 [Anaerolineaceae bacterium]|nr:hypothetical protein [Anaerolineaceae bacterium]
MSASASTDARVTRRYDHIVIGGGSAGCVVAARLADASLFPLQPGSTPV